MTGEGAGPTREIAVLIHYGESFLLRSSMANAWGSQPYVFPIPPEVLWVVDIGTHSG